MANGAVGAGFQGRGPGCSARPHIVARLARVVKDMWCSLAPFAGSGTPHLTPSHIDGLRAGPGSATANRKAEDGTA